ncbi:YciI family protein [Erythrobacter tepidarius]|uniref:YciI family protein n=1 Tax=Erythrobacter tepidarius TaxID=60454 RepID=UPI001302295F|nr:YciI family protein [Erythrobacter tepidarius]
MKLFAFCCRDVEDSAALREAALAAHLAHVEAHIDDYAVAGPLKEGERTVGSLLVIKADNAGEARARLEADPYFAAGVWATITCEEFRAVAGDWVGGAAWKRADA